MENSSVTREEIDRGLVCAAKAGDEAAFRALLEPLTRELQAYAYRMLGGYQDAEDALQETRLKAWRGLGAFEPSASGFRAWVYRIATNTCLDVLRERKRRFMPQDVGPSVSPGPPTTAARDDILWLEPYPDALLPATSSPEETLRLHESVRLAFVRAMQVLPPRQRAALVLHDVLDFAVSDIASMLETTVPAIHSALQRARASIARTPASIERGSGEDARALEARKAQTVERFVRAWETGEFDELVAMLREDATLAMPPWVYWLDGRDAIVATMVSTGTWEGEPRPGRYRIVPCSMNGQPAGLAYVRFGDGPFVPVCMTVLELAADGCISAMDTFVLPRHFITWGHPATLA